MQGLVDIPGPRVPDTIEAHGCRPRFLPSYSLDDPPFARSAPRRLNGRGYIKLGGHQRAVGRAHAGKVVTGILEEGIATVLDSDRVLRRIILRP